MAAGRSHRTKASDFQRRISPTLNSAAQPAVYRGSLAGEVLNEAVAAVFSMVTESLPAALSLRRH
jgi:hypothetical protein